MKGKLSTILFDIEGTTTPIAFVHQVLFPYSEKHLASFVRRHADDPEVRACLAGTKETARAERGEQLDDASALVQLELWIKEDRKHPALKTLQGLVWRHGYVAGEFQSAVYVDVKPALTRWKAAGLALGVYSSGSVAAQKLLFKFSDQGDLTPLLSCYFDTAVGGKRDAASYLRILSELGLGGDQVAFLSDVEEELDAAKAAGLHPVQIIRAGTKPSQRHATCKDFSEAERTLSPLV